MARVILDRFLQDLGGEMREWHLFNSPPCFFHHPSPSFLIVALCLLKLSLLNPFRSLAAPSPARSCLNRDRLYLVVVVAASLSAWLVIKQWEDRPPLNCSVDQCYFNSSALFISALISFVASPLDFCSPASPFLFSIYNVITRTGMFYEICQGIA